MSSALSEPTSRNVILPDQTMWVSTKKQTVSPFASTVFIQFHHPLCGPTQLLAPESSLSRRLIEFSTVPSFPVFPLFSYHPPSKAAPQGQPLCMAHGCFQSPVEPGSSEVNYALQPGVGSVCLLRCNARSSPFCRGLWWSLDQRGCPQYLLI